MAYCTTESSSLQRRIADILVEYGESVVADACDVLEGVSGPAVRMLFRVSGLESCQRGVCCAKVRTLAARDGCSDRTVRRRLAELAAVGLVVKHRRCCRTAWRGLTPLGRAVVEVVKMGGSLAVSAHLSAHKGVADQRRDNSPCGSRSLSVSACPVPGSVDPLCYNRPRVAARLSDATWASVAAWLGTARSVSWARCKMAHKAFAGAVMAVHRCREWAAFNRAMCSRGAPVSAECLIRLAVDDAMRCNRDFGTVETAMAYVSRVVLACVHERRLPGESGPVVPVPA